MLRRVGVNTWAFAVAYCAWVGCDGGGDCVPLEDVSGSWHGTYSTSKMPNAEIDLVLEDEGSGIEGSFTTSTGASGTLSGLQSGGSIVVAAVLSGACEGELSGTASTCGNTLGLRLTGEDCDGKHQGTGSLRRDMPDEAGSGGGRCEYADDGECDEPEGSGLCDQGTDPKDCSGMVCVGPGCQEPPPPTDCRVNPAACPASCPSTNDGVCDESNGRCRSGTDTSDCTVVPPIGCNRTNDGVCDEPEGTGVCPEGTDFSDCLPVVNPSCPFTNDGVCDEPEGTGICSEGTDVTDCFPVQQCFRTNDGTCDEPEGTGLCLENTDVADCATLVACGSSSCAAIPGSTGLGQFQACCLDAFSSSCGSSLGGACMAAESPLPNGCPDYTFAGVALPACCRPNGICGLDLPNNLGCVGVGSLSSAITEVVCDGLNDEDAGVN